MRNWLPSVWILLSLFSPLSSHALVDMKNANYSENWTFLKVPGVGYDLRVTLGYNSRSLFNGIHGYGWCSDYETKIEVTTEGNLRLTECGAGAEVNYMPKNYNPAKVKVTIRQIMEEVKKRRPDFKDDYLANLEKELAENEYMRDEFGRRLNLKGKIEDGVTYLANGKEAENITLKSGVYKRLLTDGTYQLFDASTGRMTHMYDKNQNYLKIQWEKDALVSVADNLGRKLSYKYNPTTKKVSEVVGPNGLLARFTLKGDDLVEVSDTKQKRFKFVYDDVHNLTRIDEPEGTKTLTYNKDKDWVMSFKNPKGCIETYEYNISKDDPKAYFHSDVLKKCSDKVVNKSKYEFFHRPRATGGGHYLYRVRTENNGSITDIVYHDIFGKPLSIVKDGVKTDYQYFDNGFVKTKREPGKSMAFEYENTCRKVSQVTLKYFNESGEGTNPRKPSASKSDKPTRTVKTKFIYETQKCNLLAADNSDGQQVRLQYDAQGRIAQIEDQSKKLVKIKYETKFGKPAVVTRPGLGTIQVSYKADGEIAKVESKEGPNVAIQVAGIFNNLLDIIAPATSESPL